MTRPLVRRSPFDTTQWTLVRAAQGVAQTPGLSQDRATAVLCARYWSPVHALIRQRAPDQAADLTQELFARLVAVHFRGADPLKGSLRSWLRGFVNHVVANSWRHRRAMRRDPRLEVRIDALSASQRERLEPHHPGAPELMYDRAKVQTFLDRVREKLRGEYVACGKEELFDALSCYLPGLREEQPLYRSLASDLGLEVNTLKQKINRFHDKYLKCFVRELREGGLAEEDIPQAIRDMLAVLRDRRTEYG